MERVTWDQPPGAAHRSKRRLHFPKMLYLRSSCINLNAARERLLQQLTCATLARRLRAWPPVHAAALS
eukprot:5578101-Pyramimonas_sp.AAC.3